MQIVSPCLLSAPLSRSTFPSVANCNTYEANITPFGCSICSVCHNPTSIAHFSSFPSTGVQSWVPCLLTDLRVCCSKFVCLRFAILFLTSMQLPTARRLTTVPALCATHATWAMRFVPPTTCALRCRVSAYSDFSICNVSRFTSLLAAANCDTFDATCTRCGACVIGYVLCPTSGVCIMPSSLSSLSMPSDVIDHDQTLVCHRPSSALLRKQS